jgi:hypothetical protein
MIQTAKLNGTHRTAGVGCNADNQPLMVLTKSASSCRFIVENKITYIYVIKEIKTRENGLFNLPTSN